MGRLCPATARVGALRFAESAFLLFLWPPLLAACPCNVSRSVCGSVTTSNLVFIGTVESIRPSILDRWNSDTPRGWQNDAGLVALRKENTPAALQKLKDHYLELLYDLPDEERKAIQSAADQRRLQQVINSIVTEGTRVDFRVDKIFRQAADSDDNHGASGPAKDEKDKDHDREEIKSPASMEVWNAAGDCGIAFQKGETYLVYANNDEASNRFETNVCQRTARMSDSGEDLAYLYFLDKKSSSSRLEGFVTSEIEGLHPDPFAYTGKIPFPVSDLVVELKSNKVDRFTEPEPGGRFVFDGLDEGDYQVSAFEFGYPMVVERLSGPKNISIKASGCPTTVLLVIQRGPGH